MNSNLTQIVFIIDRSSSMQPLIQSTIDGHNTFVKEQQALPGEAMFKLVQFNQEVQPYPNVPLDRVTPLDEFKYVPRGMTALFDALGCTIVEVGQELARMNAPDRPGKVIVVVITDGLENASHIYPERKQVADMIQHQQDVYQWEFIFMGANMDAVAEARAFNIPAANSMTFAASAEGVREAYVTSNRIAASLRTGN